MSTGSFGYLITQGLSNIWRNRVLTFASVGVLTACLFLVGCFMAASSNINSVLDWIGTRNVVIVYLNDNVDQAVIDKAQADIKALSNIESVEFKSKQQTLDEYKANLGSNFFEGLENDNPLPDAFYVKLSNIDLYETTVAQLKALANVNSVNDRRDVSNMLINIRQVVTLVAAILIISLLVISLFIISNTIKVTVFERRLEIHIMKYVGATDWFTRLPFIVEGFVLGLISCIVSTVLLYLAYRFLAPSLGSMIKSGFGFQPVGFSSIFPGIFGVFAAFGISTGVVGSLISIRKHLKV